jgi:hypothetical protein
MQALADVRTRTMTQADASGSIAEVSQLDLGSAHVVKSARRRALRRSLLTIRDHPAWTSGSCTDEYALGLKPSKVDVTSSNAQICAVANKIFGFDAMPLRNNPGTALLETVCVAQNGGVCVQHSFFDLVTAVVKNIYNLLKAKGVGKDQLLVMCTVGDDADVAADDPFRRFFVVDMHGAGDNIVCVGFTGDVVLRSLGSPLAIATLHRLVGRRIKALVDSISFACYDVDDAHEEGLAVRIAGVRFREAVRTRLAQHKKREVIRLAFGLTLEPEAEASGGRG